MEDRIERLFNCLELFYGDRFKRIYRKSSIERYYKAIWSSAMQGVTDEEIMPVLRNLKVQAERYPYMPPPDHFEFHRLAKRYEKPVIKRREQKKWKKR